MEGLNYFIFKGIDSRSFGVYCGCLDELVFPKLRTESLVVPGRDGVVIDSDGSYDSYLRTIECVFEENADIPKIAKWLQGSGELILSTDLTKKYEVIIENNISLTSVAIYYRNFPLELEFQPYAESIQEYEINVEPNMDNFDCGGTLDIKPIFEITAPSELTIMINDKELHLYNLDNQNILIDCKYQIMKIGNNNAASYVGGAPLNEIVLKPKNNEINVIGDYDSIKIKYRRVDLC